MNFPLTFNLVFDGPPSPEGARFIEAETLDGKSFKVGNWSQQDDGTWHLRVDCSEIYERGYLAGEKSAMDFPRS